MKIEIVKMDGGYVVQFTHGVQTFTLLTYEKTKKHAKWQKEMLDRCFDSYASQFKPNRERVIEILCKVAFHVGLWGKEPTVENVIESLKKSKCKECNILADELLSIKDEQPKDEVKSCYNCEYLTIGYGKCVWCIHNTDTHKDTLSHVNNWVKKTVESKDEIKVSPTDKEIMNQSHNVFFAHTNKEIKKNAFYLGAKWCRDNTKTVDLREELIKFLMKREYSPRRLNLMAVVKKEVDEYLKQRK